MRILIVLAFFISSSIQAQDMSENTLPYHQIPDVYSDYSSGNIVARMIDGLGYRYYWATESLSSEALEYQPSPDAQDMNETLRHLYGLSLTILNTAKGLENIRPYAIPEMDYATLRSKTLIQLNEASELFRGLNAKQMEDLEIVFVRGDRRSSFPVWNLINGPIADAIYHTGQVVSFRRTASNPINPGVNVFIGKTRQ